MLQIRRMRIPIFVSCPSPDNLSPHQERSAKIINKLVTRYKLEWRGLGRSDYPNALPLREVLRMVRHCSGGLILGFEQVHASSVVLRRGSPREESRNSATVIPTPWNQLEAGILFSASLPIMIFKESGIEGGIFDVGTSEVFIHQMPNDEMSSRALDDLDSVFQNWVANVRRHYYEE
jgi:hypothetical protein